MTDERTIAPPRAETPRLWTVAELAAAVARALSHDYEGTGNGRVTDVPGVRVIRWYQTIGLVDRPAEMRGRTALYGPRHLRQIVAIKRLQSGGRSLAEIQEALVGVPDEVLDRVARVPEGALLVKTEPVQPGLAQPELAQPGLVSPGEEPVPPAGSAPAAELVDAASLPVAVEVEGASAAEPARGRFWANRAVAQSVEPNLAVSDGSSADTATSAELSYGIPLAPGVTVLVTLPHPPSRAAVDAIRAAAAPLVAELVTHRQDGALAPDAPEPSAMPSAMPSTTHAPAERGLTEGASS